MSGTIRGTPQQPSQFRCLQANSFRSSHLLSLSPVPVMGPFRASPREREQSDTHRVDFYASKGDCRDVCSGNGTGTLENSNALYGPIGPLAPEVDGIAQTCCGVYLNTGVPGAWYGTIINQSFST